MAETVLAVAAASWGVLMGISPVLQIRRMLSERSSRDLSVGYFLILLVGFLLWICYGIVVANPVLIVPNSISFVAGAVTVMVALRLRPGRSSAR
jgi:MtN3 and saliva related transmembrane protein